MAIPGSSDKVGSTPSHLIDAAPLDAPVVAESPEAQGCEASDALPWVAGGLAALYMLYRMADSAFTSSKFGEAPRSNVPERSNGQADAVVRNLEGSMPDGFASLMNRIENRTTAPGPDEAVELVVIISGFIPSSMGESFRGFAGHILGNLYRGTPSGDRLNQYASQADGNGFLQVDPDNLTDADFFRLVFRRISDGGNNQHTIRHLGQVAQSLGPENFFQMIHVINATSNLYYLRMVDQMPENVWTQLQNGLVNAQNRYSEMNDYAAVDELYHPDLFRMARDAGDFDGIDQQYINQLDDYVALVDVRNRLANVMRSVIHNDPGTPL